MDFRSSAPFLRQENHFQIFDLQNELICLTDKFWRIPKKTDIFEAFVSFMLLKMCDLGIVMYRSEEIPKTEPAEKIIEAKIEHVSGIGIY